MPVITPFFTLSGIRIVRLYFTLLSIVISGFCVYLLPTVSHWSYNLEDDISLRNKQVIRSSTTLSADMTTRVCIPQVHPVGIEPEGVLRN